MHLVSFMYSYESVVNFEIGIPTIKFFFFIIITHFMVAKKSVKKLLKQYYINIFCHVFFFIYL